LTYETTQRAVSQHACQLISEADGGRCANEADNKTERTYDDCAYVPGALCCAHTHTRP